MSETREPAQWHGTTIMTVAALMQKPIESVDSSEIEPSEFFSNDEKPAKAGARI